VRLEEREHVRIEPFVESGAVKPWGIDADFGYGIRKRRLARDQKGEVPGVVDDKGFMPRGQAAAYRSDAFERYPVTAALGRPQLDRRSHFGKTAFGKERGERVGDHPGSDPRIMRDIPPRKTPIAHLFLPLG
jgi:hypothetical protein